VGKWGDVEREEGKDREGERGGKGGGYVEKEGIYKEGEGGRVERR